ncbi:MAG: bestrophin family protein [Candidatus Sulfotelmatobacter sp.]
MIVRQRARLRTHLLYIGRPLLALLALDVAVAAGYVFGGWTWLAVPDVPLSIFGAVIGVIAGFRNSSAYSRWWEARTIWGAVVNHSRSLARQVLTMITTPRPDLSLHRDLEESKRRLVLLQIAYVHALRNHLRRTPILPELTGLIPEQDIDCLKNQDNIPLAIQHMQAELISECKQLGWIDEIRWATLDQTLSSLMDCQGASERIKNTPMPRIYDYFIRLFISIYCVLLPVGMVASLGLWTPVGSALVGFMFLSLDRIGRDLETPFENLPQDVPLTAISRTIEINLKQMMGENSIPEPSVPVDGVLS